MQQIEANKRAVLIVVLNKVKFLSYDLLINMTQQ